MQPDPTTPALPPFLGGRVYTHTSIYSAEHWRRDLTAEPKLHRLLAHVWASFDDGFINIDALHLLDELVGGPPTWLSTTEPEPPPEDWQHAASVEGPRGLVQFVHKGEEASRAALAKLVNSASVFVTRPLSAGPKLDDEETEEDLDDVGGMVVETDPVEACLDMVSEAIEGLIGPGVTPSLSGGKALEPFVLVIGPVVVTCSAPKGGALVRSIFYTAEAIASTQGEPARSIEPGSELHQVLHYVKRQKMYPLLRAQYGASDDAPSTELAPGTLLFDWGLANASTAPPSLAAALEDPAWLNGQPPGDSVEAVMARSDAFRREMGRVLRPAQGKAEPTIMPLDGEMPGQEPLFDVETCALCDCTGDEACNGGCHWVHAEPWICSACERREGSLEAAVAKAEAWAAEEKAKKPDDDPEFAMTDDFVGPVPSGNGPEWFDEEIVALPTMTTPAVKASDVPTVTLGSDMPPILVRWLVVDEDGECVCYVGAGNEEDARSKAAAEGAEDDFRISPDPYMLDDWADDKPLLLDEGALIHARRRHRTWMLLEAVKRDHLRLGEDPDDKGLWWWEGRSGLLNSNDAESGALLKLLWDCQTASPDEALLKLGPVLQAMVQAADMAPPSYRPAYNGKLQIGRATFWVGAEFDGVAECLRQLAWACIDPNYRLLDELLASEVPTVELPAPMVTDMADAVGLADDDDVPDVPVTNHDGYTRIRGKHTETTTTLLWRTAHRQSDQLEVTCRIPGDLLREALSISTDELLRARRRDKAERALDTAIIGLEPAPGCSDEAVTVSESEDGKVCVSLHGRALVAADEEGAKVLRALGALYNDHHIKF